ncbi:MAG: ATP-binding protein [Planctomycetota bacterium]
MRILLIEDDEVDAKLFCRQVCSVFPIEPTIEHVETLAEAVQLASEVQYDLVVMDLQLPDQADEGNVGWFLDRVASAPLVVLSGLSDDLHAREALRAGAQDFLTKNALSDRDLSRRIRYALERHRVLIKLSAEREHEQDQRDRVLSHVSHELRTPMTAIVQFTSILRDGIAGEINSKQAEYLDVISSNADQLQAMIRTMVEVSRARTGKLTCDLTLGKLTSIVRNACSTMAPMAEERDLALELEVQGGLADLMFDGERVTEVLTNLIDNAIKHTPPGGRIRVLMSNEHEEGRVKLAVSDTGSGVPEDMLEDIFGRLMQVNEQSAASRKGLGLGLYLCREIVQQHGGTIQARHNEGPGLTVECLLPTFDLQNFARSMISSGDTHQEDLAIVRINLRADHGPSRTADLRTARQEMIATLRQAFDEIPAEPVPIRSVTRHSCICILAAATNDEVCAERIARIAELFDSHDDLGKQGFAYEIEYEVISSKRDDETGIDSMASRIARRMRTFMQIRA